MKFSMNVEYQPIPSLEGETEEDFIKRVERIAEDFPHEVLDSQIYDMNDVLREKLYELLEEEGFPKAYDLAGDYIAYMVFNEKDS